MCPACLAGVAWMAAGVTTTGGIAALFVSRLRDKDNRNTELDTDVNEDRTGKGGSR